MQLMVIKVFIRQKSSVCFLRLDSDAQTKAVQDSKLFTVTEKPKEGDKSLLLGKSMSILRLSQENIITEAAKDKNNFKKKIQNIFPSIVTNCTFSGLIITSVSSKKRLSCTYLSFSTYPKMKVS